MCLLGHSLQLGGQLKALQLQGINLNGCKSKTGECQLQQGKQMPWKLLGQRLQL
jgi:hypothetical protein